MYAVAIDTAESEPAELETVSNAPYWAQSRPGSPASLAQLAALLEESARDWDDTLANTEGWTLANADRPLLAYITPLPNDPRHQGDEALRNHLRTAVKTHSCYHLRALSIDAIAEALRLARWRPAAS